MGAELHIQIHPDVIASAEDILDNFPFDPGQSILTFAGGTIIVDLGAEQDTNYIQDWYLNSHEDVMSFYIVDE